MNMPMQGSASDIIKKAMVRVAEELKKNGKLRSVMIAQIHDELLFDCPPEDVDVVSKLARNVMENVVELRVPLTVEVEVGDTF
jgi:DNA polymerase-1